MKNDPNNLTGKYIIEDGFIRECFSLMKWSTWYGKERRNYHWVDRIEGLRISTIFLGLDHNWNRPILRRERGPDYTPVLWETMVFNDDEATMHPLLKTKVAPGIEEIRHSFITVHEAKAEHARIVQNYRDRLNNQKNIFTSDMGGLQPDD